MTRNNDDRAAALNLYRAIYGHKPLTPECETIVREYVRAIVWARERESASWIEQLGPILTHEGCSCDEETSAYEFELCFVHRVEAVIAARRGGHE